MKLEEVSTMTLANRLAQIQRKIHELQFEQKIIYKEVQKRYKKKEVPDERETKSHNR